MFESENQAYWTGRASGYSQVNQTELATGQRKNWLRVIREQIGKRFPGKAPEEIHILEVGCGPGFFAIILAEAGYRVTAIDYTPAMLTEARKNAGSLSETITFLEMNGEALTFDDQSFHVVVSRNLTWNLPHPEKAYGEWCRVLKPGGLLLNFDADWYGYLYNEEKREAYETDRRRTAQAGIHDEYIHTDIDAMEAIARRVPLSAAQRPSWDLDLLGKLHMQAAADEKIWNRVWSEEEKINFSATPMFLITASRPA